MRTSIKRIYQNMNRVPRNQKQAGMALPQTIMALAIIAAATAVSVQEYNTYQRKKDVAQLVDVCQKVKVAQETYVQQWKHFKGFSNSDVWRNDGWVPEAIKNSVEDQFLTPYSDDGIAFAEAATVTNRDGKTFNSAAATPRWLQTTFSELDTNSCMAFVDAIIGDALQVTVGSTRIVTNPQKVTACKAGTSVSVAVIM